MKECPDCFGKGVVNEGTDEEEQCLTCGGIGYVHDLGDENEEVLRMNQLGALGTCAAARSN